jgi:hypothetical protein
MKDFTLLTRCEDTPTVPGCLFAHPNISPSGPVCLDEANNRFIAWTGRNFDLYGLANLDHLRSFDGGAPVFPLPKQVVFVDQGRHILAGSDNGQALLYDTATGNAVRTLKYSGIGLVHQVTVRLKTFSLSHVLNIGTSHTHNKISN